MNKLIPPAVVLLIGLAIMSRIDDLNTHAITLILLITGITSVISYFLFQLSNSPFVTALVLGPTISLISLIIVCLSMAGPSSFIFFLLLTPYGWGIDLGFILLGLFAGSAVALLNACIQKFTSCKLLGQIMTRKLQSSNELKYK